MQIEKQPTLPYKSVEGSQLRVGKTYITDGDVNSISPKVYLVASYGTCHNTLIDLKTGTTFGISVSQKFIEVKAKVVWEHIL